MSGRIGKVRMKATGFEFRVIPGVTDPESDLGASLMRNAREIGTGEGLCGYVLVGLYDGGTFSTAYRWNDDRSPIPRTLMPAYMAEITRRELITDIEAERVFDSKFEWVE